MKEGEEVETSWLETTEFSRVFADILSIANDLIGDNETFYVSLIENERMTLMEMLVKSDTSFKAGDTFLLQDTYCQFPYFSRRPTIVKNAKEDERTKHNKLTHLLNAGSYAGVPIFLKDGTTFGTLCAINKRVNTYDDKTAQILTKLASFLSYAIETERLLVQDGLTSLYNRIYWKRIMSSEQIRTGVHALLMIDLDKFKQVNDQFGHETGDHVLKEVASIIQEVIPQGAYGFRFGGDEFGVLFLRRSAKEAAYFAEKIIEQSVMNEKLSTHDVCLSAGIADTHITASETLMREADQLLYRSKRSGGCRVSL